MKRILALSLLLTGTPSPEIETAKPKKVKLEQAEVAPEIISFLSDLEIGISEVMSQLRDLEISEIRKAPKSLENYVYKISLAARDAIYNDKHYIRNIGMGEAIRMLTLPTGTYVTEQEKIKIYMTPDYVATMDYLVGGRFFIRAELPLYDSTRASRRFPHLRVYVSAALVPEYVTAIFPSLNETRESQIKAERIWREKSAEICGGESGDDPLVCSYPRLDVDDVHNRRDFTYVDLSGLDLSNVEFPPGSDFTGAMLFNTKFEGAIMPRAIFNKTWMQDASFKDASMPEARFLNSNVKDGNFSGTYLGGAVADTGYFGGRRGEKPAPRVVKK